MNKKFIELCLIEINKLNKNINRNRYNVKYNDEYYLNFIIIFIH